jgi:3-hydroxyacyl-CoA dehydrogenase/enoyl-CoA hydratase/3-hydroxybutyryl-CoA epimerase
MLVEIILGKKTGDKALAAAIDYARAVKKTPVVVNDTRGFYVNRCVLRYMAEAFQMLIEGVPPAMIENAAKMAGMPVGPLALTDETAIDLAQKIMKQTIKDLGEKAVDKDQFALINTMVDKHDRFGRKNGKGFYDYPAKPAKKKLWPGLKELYPQQGAENVNVEELKQRFLTVIALEAARVMEEGIVTDPREADVGSILAFGFAPYTGGVLSYIDGIGAADFVKQAKALQKKYGAQYKAPKLLVEMAEKGDTFYRRFDPYAKAEVKAAA